MIRNIVFFFILFFLIKSIDNNESFMCIGKRDGVSGCRDCCSINFPEKYRECVNICMNSGT